MGTTKTKPSPTLFVTNIPEGRVDEVSCFSNTHTRTCTCTHTHTRTYTRAHAHAHTYALTRTHTHSLTHTHIHTYTHTHNIHAYIRTHTHTRTHIHKVEEVFKHEPGYFGYRKMRGLGFVDFEDESFATKAMIAHQNHRLPGVPMTRGGIIIDFDRDARTKRNKAYEKNLKGPK
jgi:hypothetical protein